MDNEETLRFQAAIYRSWYKFMGSISKFHFLFKYYWLYVFTLMFTVIVLTDSFLNPPLRVYSLIIAIASSTFGIVVLMKETFRVLGLSDLSGCPDNKSKLLDQVKLIAPYDVFKLFGSGDERAIYNEELNIRLLQVNLKFKRESEVFKLTQSVRKLAPFSIDYQFRFGKALRNFPKVRLASDLTIKTFEENNTLSLQRTDYFSSLCTNEMTGIIVSPKDRPTSVEFDGLAFMCGENKHLLDLSASSCSNHIGVNVIAFTKDSFMLILIQSMDSAQGRLEYAPSGSGSADFKDYVQHGDNFIIAAMKRELAEECNVKGKMKKEFMTVIETKLIGYARNLGRGGKPEFFGVSFINKNYEEIKGLSAQEMMFIERVKPIRFGTTSKEAILDGLEEIKKDESRRRSIALELNLLFLEQSLNSNCERVMNLIQGKTTRRN